MGASLSIRISKVIVSVALLVWGARMDAGVVYDQFSELPHLPTSVLSLPLEERITWYKAAIAAEEAKRINVPVEIYRLKRNLFYDYYWYGFRDEARAMCNASPPLKKDFYYRENCNDVLRPQYDDYLPYMLDIIYEAKQSAHPSDTAFLISNLAWRQAQVGDIASAFENYELALATAPPDDMKLINTITMDSATTYIVHGDEHYVEKGIGLLDAARDTIGLLIEKESDPDERAMYEQRNLLTYFNTAVAYTMHLQKYEKALANYRIVAQSESRYLMSALSFGAFVAAKLDRYEDATWFLEKIGGRKDEDQVIDHYLECYRQMAIKHWSATQPIDKCMPLPDNTALEVKLDVYKRLADMKTKSFQDYGKKMLGELFMSTIEPELKKRGARAASRTELRRLERESELKTLILDQQKALQAEQDASYRSRMRFLVSLFVILVITVLFVFFRFRQKRQLAEQFQKLSTLDPLTQLGNRRFLEQNIEAEFDFVETARKTSTDTSLGIYVFDIDHFKKINDSLGHQAGDEVLVEISARIKRIIRPKDILVRWGGEEFVLVMRLESDEKIYTLADRIIAKISQEPFSIHGHATISVTCTIGIVKYPFINTSNSHNWTRLISLADNALYYGKRKHRNCWVYVANKGFCNDSEIDRLANQPLEETLLSDGVWVRTSF